MPRFMLLAKEAKRLLKKEDTTLEVEAFLLSVLLCQDDFHRYQYLREKFGMKSMEENGDYTPTFPEDLLKSAQTLDASVSDAMRREGREFPKFSHTDCSGCDMPPTHCLCSHED